MALVGWGPFPFLNDGDCGESLVSEIYIVQGDLECLSTSIGVVAGDVAGVDVSGDLGSVSTGMRGASSPGTAASTAQTIDDGLARVKTCFDDLADDVLRAAYQFQASDAQAAQSLLGSAGVLDPWDPGYQPPVPYAPVQPGAGQGPEYFWLLSGGAAGGTSGSVE